MKKKIIRGALGELTVWAVLLSFTSSLFHTDLFLIGKAYAADLSVMIIPLPDPGRLEYAMIDGLAKALKDTGRFDVVDRKETEKYARSKSGDVSLKNLDKIFEEAVVALKEGQSEYNALRTDNAIKILKEAKLKFKEALPAILKESDYSRYLGTYFYLAMAYQAKGMPGDAARELADMVRIDPKRASRKFSSKHYPPKILELYESVKKDVLKGDVGSLSVKSRPSQAKVYIDGNYAGDTPLETGKIPVGEHFITVKKDGHIEWSDLKFIIKGKNTVDRDLKQSAVKEGFVKAVPVKSSFDIDRDVALLLDEMSVSLGGDVFLLYEFSLKGNRGDVRAQLYDQRNQEVSKVEEAKISDTSNPIEAFAELASKLAAHMNAEGYVSSQRKGPDLAPLQKGPDPSFAGTMTDAERGKDKGELEDPYGWKALPRKKPGLTRPWYEKWWVWAIIAGGLGAATGSVFLFTDVGKAPASKSTLRVNR